MSHGSEGKLREPKQPDLKVLEKANVVAEEIANKVANTNALHSHYQGGLFRVAGNDASYVAKLLHSKLPPGFSTVPTAHLHYTAASKDYDAVQVYPNSAYNHFRAWMGWFSTHE